MSKTHEREREREREREVGKTLFSVVAQKHWVGIANMPNASAKHTNRHTCILNAL